MDKLSILLKQMDTVKELEKTCEGLKLYTVQKYINYYYNVNAYTRQGVRKSEAITWTADEFKTTERQIYRALAFFDK